MTIYFFHFFFYLSFFFLFYIYLGYPILVYFLGFFFDRQISKGPITPFVSILISAYNEEDFIGQTILNKLAQNYPSHLLEIIVVSDASTDNTEEIVKSIDDNRVKLFVQKTRAGKTEALNFAISQAKGDIILFSDANSIYEPNAISRLVANFSDPKVGYVTGKMIYANLDGSLIGDGCSAYMRYENILRKFETRIGSIVGVDGGIDAIRKMLYTPMRSDQLPDFVLPLMVSEQNFRVVFEPAALLWETTLNNPSDEYRMRVRVSLRAWWALFDMRQLLFSIQNPLYCWQIWSHKILRYCSFLFIVFAFISNYFLIQTGLFFYLFFILQIFSYLLIIIEPFLSKF